MLQYVSLPCSIFQCVTVYFCMFECISVCYSILHYVTVYFRMQQYILAWCSRILYLTVYFSLFKILYIYYYRFLEREIDDTIAVSKSLTVTLNEMALTSYIVYIKLPPHLLVPSILPPLAAQPCTSIQLRIFMLPLLSPDRLSSTPITL